MSAVLVHFVRLVRGLLPVALLAGCSTIGVRIDPRPDIALCHQNRQVLASLKGASPALEALRASKARGLSAEERLASLLTAARLALPGAVKSETEAMEVYNIAVAEVATIMQKEGFKSLPVSGSGGTRQLSLVSGGRNTLDPAQAQVLIPAAGVSVKGLQARHVQSGLGVPYVFAYAKNSPFLAGQPGIPRAGMALPATAVLAFDGAAARLSFRNTLNSDHLSLQHRPVRLAADFSAPIAVIASRSANRSIDVRAFLFTRQRLGTAGLFQYQPYDPNRIPVIFVHGLLSRPEAWVQALNGLVADPTIRKHYQFWFLLYPTGLPVWESAALLRSELDRYHRTLEKDGFNPNLHRIVLIGHSMGGLISSLTVREGGEHLWSQFSDTPFNTLTLSPEAREVIKSRIFFPPRNDIGRVIFVATPHRGSALALNPIAGFFSRLIQLPSLIGRQDRHILLSAIRDDLKGFLTAPANSIRFLQADSPLIRSIQALPLSRKIPYHSIIGDRGRGDTPSSSDGVVPYWSSHIEGSASEKIVPSGHGANEHPEGIEEMRRILLEAAPD